MNELCSSLIDWLVDFLGNGQEIFGKVLTKDAAYGNELTLHVER